VAVMSEDRVVKTTLVIDEHGAVRAVHAVGSESGHTESKLGKLDKSIKGLGHSFGGLKGLVAGGLGLGTIAYGLKSVLGTTSELAEETHKFHTITGIGGQSSLFYTAALKARGIGAEAGGNAFKFLAKNIQIAERQEQTYGLAQGKATAKHKIATGLLGVQATAFKRLGIDLTSFSHLSEQGKFEDITHKFESMKDGVEKTRLEVQIFGRGGTALSSVLDKGALSLSHADDMAKRFFPTLKGGTHELEELQEKQTESKMAWEGLEFTLGTQVVPVFNAVAGEFSHLIGEAEKGKGPLAEVEHVFEGIAHFGESAFKFVKGVADQFGIHLGAGTLGAGLVALEAAHRAKKITHTASAAKKIAEYGVHHPETLPVTLAAAGATAYGLDVYKSRDELAAHAKGALAMLGGGPTSLSAIEEGILGRVPHGSGGGGRYAHAGGRAEKGSLSPAESAAVSRLLERPQDLTSKTALTAGELAAITTAIERAMASHNTEIYVDGKKLAEALRQNPGASRHLSEAVTHYAQKQAARR
jgi:hypothetical protein